MSVAGLGGSDENGSVCDNSVNDRLSPGRLLNESGSGRSDSHKFSHLYLSAFGKASCRNVESNLSRR
jgi:hypothetical protein